MDIKIRKELAELIGVDKLEKFGASETGWAHRDAREIDLALLGPKALDELEALITKQVDKHGVDVARGGVAARYYIQVWRRAISGKRQQRARTALQMAAFLKLLLDKVPGHRVYKKHDDVWLAHYVARVSYREKQVSRDGVIPARVSVEMVYEELGGRKEKALSEYEYDVRGLTAQEFLARHNYHLETDEFRAEYLRDKEKFLLLQPQVGLQLEARGEGTDDLDGNDDGDHHWYHSTRRIALGTASEPSRVVVDVFREVQKEERENKVHVDPLFWRQKSVRSEDDDSFDGDDAKEPTEEAPPEIPLHPYLAIFDLSKHLRLRVHVRDVEVHKYDESLADKLVLPDHLKALVSLLIEHRAGGFKDIVRGKSGGAVVLLAGAPGTGKTLTAEVYAEAEGRALYSVQCSQLGVKPDELEEALLKCFARCGRWNAVMLLDEADVYVHARGDDLTQNAVVGVFLRVLEYQSAVLFLTTNRAKDVDDAIASRCVARLNYEAPTPTDQARIWRILADGSGAALSNSDIKTIVTENPALTGRDVKNLLKLAMLMAKGKLITASDVEYVKQFKPTATRGEKR